MAGRQLYPFESVWILVVIRLVPVAVIVLLPDEWYWHILRALAGFAILGFLMNDLTWRSMPGIGNAGPGLALSMVLFGALLFDLPVWLKVVVGLLLAHTVYVSDTIIRKHLAAQPTLQETIEKVRKEHGVDT
jgi:hypothetical protein